MEQNWISFVIYQNSSPILDRIPPNKAFWLHTTLLSQEIPKNKNIPVQCTLYFKRIMKREMFRLSDDRFG